LIIRTIEIIRDDDLVARLGGDEFAIIMTCASDSYSLQAVAERILAAICTPFVVSGHGINIGASIGIAVIDSCTQDAADILRYADMALYRAKNEGRNRACIYDAAMDADLSNRKLLESALRQAVKNRELHVVHQAIVDRSGKRLVAWKRWRAGFTRCRAKSRRRALFRSPNIQASLSSLANSSCAAPALTAAIGPA
jgi:predicted signal transduction protein with EAL and GGDEF domain